tara:strand:+ start:301 stop:765 length:465 start_codon:yes stop_codon:yes gene_type:complete
MFKRKQAKPVNIGDLCAIDINIVDKIKKSSQYLFTSSSNYAKTGGYIISERLFKKFDRKLIFADVKLFYVKKNSIFDGIVEVVPLFYDDSRNGYLARRSMNKNTVMLVSKKSLVPVSNAQVIDVRYDHNPALSAKLEIMLTNSHGVKDFSWDVN